MHHGALLSVSFFEGLLYLAHRAGGGLSMGMDRVCTSKSPKLRQNCWSQGGGMGGVFYLLV